MTEYIIGTQTTVTNKWTGRSSRTKLFDNMAIRYKLPTNSTSNPTLNLTLFNGSKSGEIPISTWYTSFNAGDEILLTYSASKTGTGAWYTDDIYHVDDDATIMDCWTDGASPNKACNDSSVTVTSGSSYSIKFVYSNTAARALTLNINGTGAKPIYINGVVSSTTNYNIPAGNYSVSYDGSSYRLRTGGNLSGVADAAKTLTETLPVDKGGTGSTSASAARTNLGINSLVTTRNYLYAYTVDANSALTITCTDLGITVPSGYKALCASKYSTGNADVAPYILNGDSTSGNFVVLKNTSSSSVSATFTVTQSYIRNV